MALNLCWLVSDDFGGGVISVAVSCVRQAAAAGHRATLLLVQPSGGWLAGEDHGGAQIESLAVAGQVEQTPMALLNWLKAHPQDVIVFNSCDEAEPAIPFLPPETRCIYAVHDTAPRYWSQAVRLEQELDAITVVSRHVADEVRDRLDDPAMLSVIYPGSRFPAECPPATGRAEAILFCGGDNPAKGALDLVRLWTLWARRGVTRELHWYGGMTPAFERRVRALPGAERIHLYGHASREAIFAQAGRCRACMMLSRAEAFGMVIIEALSMGCIPVAWDIALGTREIITEGETGLLVALGDYAALSVAVDGAMRIQPALAEGVMQWARERFSEPAQWGRYEALCAAMLAQPRAARSGRGTVPPYQPPRRYYQLLPASVRNGIRALVGRFPRLGYRLRNCRGW